MNRSIAQIIEQRHNVIVDSDSETYNHIDTEYGWQPIPALWYIVTLNAGSNGVTEYDTDVDLALFGTQADEIEFLAPKDFLNRLKDLGEGEEIFCKLDRRDPHDLDVYNVIIEQYGIN